MAEKRGLDGAALKRIAALSMLIDHIGLVLLYHGWMSANGRSAAAVALYNVLRSFGRLAFPLFCFLLTEGFVHTRSRARYLLRLLVFALLSELPCDLAANGAALEFGHQNVFFTHALGLLAVWAWDAAEKQPRQLAGAALAVVGAGGCMAAARLLKTDYGAFGVLLILVMYALRDRALWRDLGAALVLAAMVLLGGSWKIEYFALLALPLLHLYNGERGRQSRIFFYVFYPGHLLLLYGLQRLLWGG